MKFTLPEPVTQTNVVFLTVNHRGPLPLRELHSTDEIIVWRDPRGSWACLRPIYWTSEFTLPQAVTQTNGIFVKQVVVLTVNHRGPLPLRELHSTDETIVWRDPGGSWACLPVYETNEFTLPQAVTQTSGIFVKQVVFLTVNHRGPLPLRELHSTDEIIVWRDPRGSWACLRPIYWTSEFTLPQAVTQTNGIFVKQVVVLTVNHRGPLPLRELHSTDETIVWRDPGGSWAYLPVYETNEFTLPQAVTQTSGIFVKQVVFLTVNHRGPLPLRELHSTDE